MNNFLFKLIFTYVRLVLSKYFLESLFLTSNDKPVLRQIGSLRPIIFKHSIYLLIEIPSH